MDRRERIADSEETLRALFQSMQAGLWTASPGIVESFNPGAMTAVVQPSIMSRLRAPDGTLSFVKLPLLLDCPVKLPWGGGFGLTVPIAQGDECLVVFSSRCIDAWWQSGGVQVPPEIRMHDLSDGFCLPGVFSQPKVIPNYSTTTTQLRNQAGDTYVEVAPGGQLNLVAPTGILLNTPVVTITGIINTENVQGETDAFTVTGTIRATGDVQANSGALSLINHVHLDGGGVGNSGAATG